MKYKAVESVLTYPDGFNALTLVEGKEYENLEPSTLSFLLERGIVAPVTPVQARETKPASKVTRVSKKSKVADEIKGNNTTSD